MLIQQLQRSRNRLWWRVVESSGEEWIKGTEKERKKAHQSACAQKHDEIQNSRDHPQTATTTRVTQFVFQMNNFHHLRVRYRVLASHVPTVLRRHDSCRHMSTNHTPAAPQPSHHPQISIFSRHHQEPLLSLYFCRCNCDILSWPASHSGDTIWSLCRHRQSR
jgi:hypothetical protein